MGITPESQAKLEVIAPSLAMLEAFKHSKYTNNYNSHQIKKTQPLQKSPFSTAALKKMNKKTN